MDAKLKYLDFLQAIITRMASNSFVAKGWSVTLVTAVLGLAAKDSNPRFAAVALIPCLSFWFIDAYFLKLERQFRNIFANASLATDASFRMQPEGSEKVGLGKALRSGPMIGLHLPLMLVVLVTTIYGWVR